MICHSQIATDRPLIQQMAQMQEKGLDFAWQRVYDYPRSAHVRFEHSPHIRAGVECSTCHGDQKQQTVARRMVNMDMGFCVNCHRREAGVERLPDLSLLIPDRSRHAWTAAAS